MKKELFRNEGCPVLLLIIIDLFVIICQLLSKNCLWWDCAPKRDFSINELDLPIIFFPEDSQTRNLHYSYDDVSYEKAAISQTSWNKGESIYIVRFYTSENLAIKSYNYSSKYKFTSELEDLSSYKEILDYQSDFADLSVITCGFVASDCRCVYIARYQEFVILFSGTVGEKGMTQDNFIGVIDFIDNKMETLLSKE
mgnify:CR=1 FL=1